MWTRSIGGYCLKWLAMKRKGSEECCIISSKLSNLYGWVAYLCIFQSIAFLPNPVCGHLE